MGLANSAAMFQHRVYRRDPTIENMYLALNRFIHAGRTDRVIEFSEKFFEHQDHQRIIDHVNNVNWNRTQNDYIRSIATNERDRLKRAWISALLDRGQNNMAMDIALETFDTVNIDLQQPSFAYFTISSRIEVSVLFSAYFIDYAEKFIERYEKLEHELSSNLRLRPAFFIEFVERSGILDL